MSAEAFDLVRLYRTEIAAFVVAYAAAEVVWLRLWRGRDHARREVLANVLIFAVDTAIRVATWPARLAVFLLVSSLSPLEVPTTVASAIACYIGVDLILYAWHRVLHETELGWALHSVHHSSRELDVSVGVRINWLQRAIDDVVYLPLAALGFDPLLVLAMVALNRLSQYWVHTEQPPRPSRVDRRWAARQLRLELHDLGSFVRDVSARDERCAIRHGRRGRGRQSVYGPARGARRLCSQTLCAVSAHCRARCASGMRSGSRSG
jgi:hypothetical protein